MRIGGIQKLSLLDYPDKTCCTLFTAGCNFRCPFCHNRALVCPEEMAPPIAEDEVLTFLQRRRGVLDGVCVSGGEPLMQPGLDEFLRAVKEMGFWVKLDTNGSYPDTLAQLAGAGLIDYVAMDIKGAPGRYAEAAGVPGVALAPVEQSLRFLLGGGVPDYELRTTVVRELHDVDDFAEIGRWIAGAKRYFLQAFVDGGALLAEGLHGCGEAEMAAFLQAVRPFVPAAGLRGL